MGNNSLLGVESFKPKSQLKCLLVLLYDSRYLTLTLNFLLVHRTLQMNTGILLFWIHFVIHPMQSFQVEYSRIELVISCVTVVPYSNKYGIVILHLALKRILNILIKKFSMIQYLKQV